MMERGIGKIQPAVKMAKKSIKDKPATKPEWLQQIAEENLENSNRLFEARCHFVAMKLDVEKTIEDINNRYGTEFQLGDLFSIKPEEEEAAIDMLDLDDD